VLYGLGFEFWQGKRLFSSPNIRPGLGGHPASYSLGIRGNFLRVGAEA